MIWLTLTLWITGILFTIGVLTNEPRPHNELAKYMAIFIWPALLGVLIGEYLRNK